jgi:Protoglobin
MTGSAIKHIDERRLESDLGYRFQYLTEFMGFDQTDIDSIHGMAPHLAPLVDGLVDAVYVKLFGYDATKRHFLPRQSGYEGKTPTNLSDLTLTHDQIQFRKAHLATYLKKLVTANYDAKLVGYLDFVGKMHTPAAGAKDLHVPLVQMNALMGFVSDALVATIQSLDLENAAKAKAVRSFCKLLWLQNDLISRHYVARG